jgi:hypothetical protein
MMYLGFYEPARKLFDGLGSFEDRSLYWNPATGKCMVPFSLQLIRAVLPSLLGDLRSSQVLLYDLLDRCENVANDPLSPPHERLLSVQRSKKVRRALVVNHLESREANVALSVMDQLTLSESSELRHLIALQQIALIALRSGNSFVAQEAFQRIERHPVDDEDASPEENERLNRAKKIVVSMNAAFHLCFHAHFDDACGHLQSALADADDALKPFFPIFGASDSAAAVVAVRDVPEVVLFMRLLRTYITNSLAVCLAFVSRHGGGPVPNTGPPAANAQGATWPQSSAVAAIVQLIESSIRIAPQYYLKLDATLYNLRRIYELEGDESAQKVGTLMDLVELFRCAKEAIPKERKK